MKSAFTILVLILAVIACGCTASAPATAPAVTPAPTTSPVIPDLKGTWTGPMQGYDQGTGFSDYPTLGVKMTITEQKGRVFAGDVVFTANGTDSKSGFAGTIGRDGRTLSIAEEAGGYCTGEIVGENEMELIYMEDGSPYSIAIDSFKRV
ncbi:MAG: hypothetical protein WC379_11105 [Methanoregula sp.]|jgi:hypothetical protein